MAEQSLVRKQLIQVFGERQTALTGRESGGHKFIRMYLGIQVDAPQVVAKLMK
jgi:hypothetical protein